MLVYKRTFDNIKNVDGNFPIEDQYFASSDEAIVADGITRDPIGCSDLASISQEEFVKKYPNPSGAYLAAKEICNTFSITTGSLYERLIKCNESVKLLNNKYILKCDYLESDYYGAVAACIRIENNILNYAYICDCGVIVYDKKGNIKFQTADDKGLYSDPYINKIGIPWNLAEARVIVRRDYRNNINNIKDGKCVSYGAITGEDAVREFIRYGSFNLEKNDIVLVYSDGFTKFLHDGDFVEQIVNFDVLKFEDYVNKKALSDYSKYGKEKTIVMFINKE